jgi:uncharacterized membrane protein YfcA
MLKTELTLPQLFMVVGTRGMLGAGLGLLLADRLGDEQRRALGWTLAAIGVLTTAPLIKMVYDHRRADPSH